jgi:hypothetical protein
MGNLLGGKARCAGNSKFEARSFEPAKLNNPKQIQMTEAENLKRTV